MNVQTPSFIGSVDQAADRLATAGLALETLAELLGFDGGEHHLSATQMYGLSCAVSAIGALVKDAGFCLSGHAELEARK